MRGPAHPTLRAAEAATWGGKPVPRPQARIRKFQAFQNEARTIAGFFSVELASGLILNDCRLMVGQAGKRWVALPSVKLTDKEGQPILDAAGKQRRSPVVDCRDKQTRERLQGVLLHALRASYPELFHGEPA